MSNVDIQSKEFGNFIDQRASTPITINRKLTMVAEVPTPTKLDRMAQTIKREESIFKIKEVYFSSKLTESSKKHSSDNPGNSSANRDYTESSNRFSNNDNQLLMTPVK